MFRIIHSYHQESWTTALNQALSFDLSWLQSFFALLGAPILAPTPAALQIYNSLAIMTLMIAIFSAAKALGSSNLKAYLVALICFIPDAFWGWNGGFPDLRRDFAFVALLGATYFLCFSFQWRPSWSKSCWLGLLASLTILSRSNGIFLVIFLLFPILGTWILYQLYTRHFASVKRLIPAVLIFSTITGLNLYATYDRTVSRYQDPFTAYGIGGTRWESIMAHWNKPFLVMFGRPEETLIITLGSLVFFSLCLAVLVKKRILDFVWNQLINKKILFLLFSGVWMIVANLFLMCVLVVVRPLNFEQTQFMFYPSIIGFLSLLFMVAVAIKAPGFTMQYRSFYRALAGLICCGILLISLTRIILRTHSPAPDNVRTATQLANVLNVSTVNASQKIAFLWHEGMSIDTLYFYLAQLGKNAPAKFFYQGPQGEQLDFAVTTPPGTDVAALQQSIQRQIKQGANFVVINADPREYDNPEHHFFIFKYGKPIVEALKSDPQFKVIYQYSIPGIWSSYQHKSTEQHFLVLQNMGLASA
jgi:hypothetical protein